MSVHTKRAVTDAGMVRLRHEAAILESVRHPGVVDLVDFTASDDRAELRVAAIAGPSLAEADPLSVEEIAGVMAAVTATLADLHALGVVHRAVEPGHVVLAPDGQPVLCGFGSAARVEDGADPARDVRAVGETISALLATLADDGGRSGRHLASIARHAVESVPPASVLAAQLAARIEGSRLPGAPAVRERARPVALGELLRAPRRRRLRPRLRHLMVVSFFVVVAAIGTRAVVPTGGAEPPLIAAPATTRVRPSTTTTSAPAAPVRVWPTSTSTSSTTTTTALVHGGHRWDVGEPGDVVVTGDWNCTGVDTVALLRPSTGVVYVFPDWNDDAVPATLGTVDGATALAAADRDGDGCDDVVVTRHDGDPVVLQP